MSVNQRCGTIDPVLTPAITSSLLTAASAEAGSQTLMTGRSLL